MRNVLESTTIIDHYPAVIDRYFKHRHSIHKGPFHIYIYMCVNIIYIYIYTYIYIYIQHLASIKSNHMTYNAFGIPGCGNDCTRVKQAQLISYQNTFTMRRFLFTSCRSSCYEVLRTMQLKIHITALQNS